MLYFIWFMAFYIHFPKGWLCTCELHCLLSFMAQETEQAKLMRQLRTVNFCASVSVGHISIYKHKYTVK